MRIMIFFDLPTNTAKERKAYSRFRKFLINEGFIMMQESVYVKLALNNSIAKSVREKVTKNKPEKGIVQMLVITEQQFNSMEYIVGKMETNVLENTERLFII